MSKTANGEKTMADPSIKETEEMSIWIEKRVHTGGYTLPRHYEHCYQVLILLSGRVLYTVGEKNYEMQPGEMILLNTLEEHTLQVLEYPYERYILQIGPDFFRKEMRYPRFLALFMRRSRDFSHCVRLPAAPFAEVLTALEEMEKECAARQEYWDLAVGACMRRMFITILRAMPELSGEETGDSGTAIAYKAVAWLDRHYLEDVSLDSLAGALYLNKHYISHVFRETVGNSIMDYVITLRLNLARGLLVSTDRSITDIAQVCGYTDFAYFSRLFRKKTGVSPSTFRKTGQVRQTE